MIYCISCWGGVSRHKLQNIFTIQKRCIRLLFGKNISFDHEGFYDTCARARTFEVNMAPKIFCLEHTKPLFNEHKILSLHNLYTQSTFMELFKIIKYRSPISMYNLFKFSTRDGTLNLRLPCINLETTKSNFIFKVSSIWNSLIGSIFNKCQLSKNNLIIIPGSEVGSDMSASTGMVKYKLKTHLYEVQNTGDEINWVLS